jgi:serine/threonine protein kinase
MTEAEIGWIMGQVLLGLAYLHSKDHVHGDIKARYVLKGEKAAMKLNVVEIRR